MTQPYPAAGRPFQAAPQDSGPAYPSYGGGGSNLADILERVLDKGIVIAGDIQVNLLDIELLTIKLRLLVASVDRAREMGIDWWEHDPSLSSSARRPAVGTADDERQQYPVERGGVHEGVPVRERESRTEREHEDGGERR